MSDKDRFIRFAKGFQGFGNAAVCACQIVDRRRAAIAVDMGGQLLAGRFGAVVRGHAFLDFQMWKLAAQDATKPHFPFLLGSERHAHHQ